VFAQPADKDLARAFHDAGADRVIVRSEPTHSDAEMSVELERIAEAVLA
jgi:hypothetical protein